MVGGVWYGVCCFDNVDLFVGDGIFVMCYDEFVYWCFLCLFESLCYCG